MRMANWRWGGVAHAGTVSPCGREVMPLAVPQPERGALRLIQMLARGEPQPRVTGPRLPLKAMSLCAPLPRPLGSLFCVGRNYRARGAALAATVFRESLPELSSSEAASPIVFTNFTNFADCVARPFDAVKMPARQASVQIDYKSELSVVIGRGGVVIARSRAIDHVFGCTVVNDVLARDVQGRHQQWSLGKSFDTLCPMGPRITAADELDGRRTRVRGWVSGELRQNGGRHDMNSDMATLIKTCSRGITLHPGDVIATGAPAGMGMGFTPPRCLQGGRYGADRDRSPRRRREPVSVRAARPFRRRSLALGQTAHSAWGAAA